MEPLLALRELARELNALADRVDAVQPLIGL
jgi:hypothetical protein